MEQLVLEGGRLLLIVSPWGHSSQRVRHSLESEQQTAKEDHPPFPTLSSLPA